MSVTKDNATYEALHDRLLRDMLLAIKDELEAADLDHDTVHELTANIAMAVTTLLDGGSPTQLGGEQMMPFVAFSSESQRDHLIVNDHGSHLHQLVDSLFESMEEEEEFDDDEDEDEEDDYEYEEDEEEDESDEEEDLDEEADEEESAEEDTDKRRH